MENRRQWLPGLITALGLSLTLALVLVIQVLATQYELRHTTLEDFNAGTLYRTGLTRHDDGEVQLLALGIAGEWITDTNTTDFVPVLAHCAVEHNDWIYVLGGQPEGVHSIDDIYRSAIDPDTHALGDWVYEGTLEATAYGDGVRKHACLVLNDRLYVIGGQTPTGHRDAVTFATINPDGSLGSWQTTIPLPAPRYSAEAATVDGYLYVLGGVEGVTAHNQVWFSEPSTTTGQISRWFTTTQMFEDGYYGHRVATYDGRIYVTGGSNAVIGGDFFSYVDFGTVVSNGAVSSWARSSHPMHRNLFAHDVYIVNGQLFTLGGADNNASTATSFVASSLLAPNGNPGEFIDSDPIDPARFWHAAVTSVDGWLYVIGGTEGLGSAPIGTLEGAINQGGTAGITGDEFLPDGDYLSPILQVDEVFDRRVTGLSWNATISDTSAMSLTMMYRYRPGGAAWSAWQGPLASSSETGTVTTTHALNLQVRQFQYHAFFSTTVDATPVLNQVVLHYDIPQTPVLDKISTPPNGSHVQRGSTISYTISYQNQSASLLTGVSITDDIPISTTVVMTSVTGPNPTVTAEAIYWDLGTLEAGEAGSVGFQVTVSPEAAEDLLIGNRAFIGSQVADTGYSNLVEHVVWVPVEYDLSVRKDDGLEDVEPGQWITYTIVVTNTNQEGKAITSAVLTDTISPFPYVYHPFSEGWLGVTPGVYVYSLGTLEEGVPKVVSFTAWITEEIPLQFGEVVNTIEVEVKELEGIEPDKNNNLYTDIDVLHNYYDLMVVKYDGVEQVKPGELLTYTIAYTNTTVRVPLTGVVLTETVEPAEHITHVGGGPWTEVAPGSGVYRAVVGDLSPGATGEMTFAVQIDRATPVEVTQIINTVDIGDDGTNGTELALENNRAVDSDLLAPLTYDLQVVKGNGFDDIAYGQMVTYTIVYTNVTEDEVTVSGVVLTETLQPLPYASYVGSGPWVEVAPGVYEAQVGDLLPGEGGSLPFVVQVSATVPAEVHSVTNTVQIAHHGALGVELTTDNNTAEDVDPIVPLTYDLQVSKDDGTYTAEPGQTLTYTIAYQQVNGRGLPVAGVVITETLDPAAYMAHLGGQGWQLVAPGVYTQAAGTLADGEGGTLTFTVYVSTSLPISDLMGITNTVEIGAAPAAGIEGDPADNLYHEIDVVNGSDLIAALILQTPEPHADELMAVDVQVTNVGTKPVEDWFWVELYAKEASFEPSGPPVGATDHNWGYLDPIAAVARSEYIASLPGLGAGETVVVTFSIVPTMTGEYTLYAQVDTSFYPAEGYTPWGRVLEANELNNIDELAGIMITEATPAPIYLPLVFRNG